MSGLRSFALALVLAFGVPALSHAQTDNGQNTAANSADRDNHRDWGWLGLLGLIGLAGLKRQDRAHDRADDRVTGTRTTART